MKIDKIDKEERQEIQIKIGEASIIITVIKRNDKEPIFAMRLHGNGSLLSMAYMNRKQLREFKDELQYIVSNVMIEVEGK